MGDTNNLLNNLSLAKENPFLNGPLTLPSGKEIASRYHEVYNNTKRPLYFRTMIPMCLYVNDTDLISRVDFPYIDRKTNKSVCNLEGQTLSWQKDMSASEKAKWKRYTYWVFNVTNLPPLPSGMAIFQIVNKNKKPWNTIGMNTTGLVGSKHSGANQSIIGDMGVFSFITDKADNIWRFMTYTQPVPNTTKLYIYNTANRWNVSTETPTETPDAPDLTKLLNSKNSKYGVAGPIGSTAPPQLFITPNKHPKLLLRTSFLPYIWVCDKEYTQFVCPNSIIVPYDKSSVSTLYKNLKSLGYWSALRQSVNNTGNWIKYRHGDDSKARNILDKINYFTMRRSSWKKQIIIFSLLLLCIILFTTMYLFKNKLTANKNVHSSIKSD